MRLEQRGRISQPNGRTLDLPPPFRAVMLREVGDAFVHACANAADLGAGALVFVGRFDIAEFAVVLEPDEPLVSTRRVFYAGMVALGAALAASAPPEKPIAIEWPDAFRVDLGLVGGGRLGWPADAPEEAVPDWLAFGAAIRTVHLGEDQAGLHPLATALETEGFWDFGAEQLAERFARHLMVALDRWQEGGFACIAAEYTSKLQPVKDVRYTIDAKGDLSVESPGKPVEHRDLLRALRMPSWLDLATGAPRI